MSAMHRQVYLLVAAQALFQTASVLMITVGGLAGAMLAPSDAWATAPIATMFLGTATGTVPASLWLGRAGRRTGFMTGTLLGVIGGLLAAGGMVTGSLALLCVGTFFVGAYQSFAQFYRFAAAEVANDSFRPRAVSLVLAGGVFAAFAGPALARFGSHALSPTFTAAFLLLTLISLLAMGLLAGLKPDAPVSSAETAAARGLLDIIRQPTYIVALFGALTGYSVMIIAMTATPLAMAHHHHGIDATSTVIQFHVLGMFVPSFFTGTLIARLGVVPVMLAGVALLIGHVLMTLTGTSFYSFTAALILLGIGWNFLYIGGTNLLTRTYTSAEKGKAQATNDLTIVVIGFLASLSAGALQNAFGWQVLNLWLLPLLVACAVVMVWFGVAGKRG